MPIALKRLCEKLVRHLTISPLLRPYCSVLPNSWWKHLFEALDVVPEVVNFSHPIFSDFLSSKEVLFWLSCLSPPVLGKIFSNLMLTLQLLEIPVLNPCWEYCLGCRWKEPYLFCYLQNFNFNFVNSRALVQFLTMFYYFRTFFLWVKWPFLRCLLSSLKIKAVVKVGFVGNKTIQTF